MVEIRIEAEGAFGSARVELGPGERFVSESGALYHATPNVDVDVTTRTRGGGGILKGLGRLFAGESFFLSTYTTDDGQPGAVGLAPTLQGSVARIDLDGATGWLCTGASFLGAGAGLGLETRFQGLKGLFSGEGLFLVEVRGEGPLLVSAFGSLFEETVEGELVVDTGHVVAFEDTLTYETSRAGGSWLQSFLGGEGFVMRFRGSGRVWLQSHSPNDYGQLLGRILPPRRQ